MRRGGGSAAYCIVSESDSSSKIICVCLVLSRHSRKKAGRARHGATAGGQSGEAHGPCGCVGVAASQHIASCLRAIARRRYHGLCLGLSRHSRKNAHTPPPTRAAAAGKSRVALEWARIQPMNHVVSRGQVELMFSRVLSVATTADAGRDAATPRHAQRDAATPRHARQRAKHAPTANTRDGQQPNGQQPSWQQQRTASSSSNRRRPQRENRPQDDDHHSNRRRREAEARGEMDVRGEAGASRDQQTGRS